MTSRKGEITNITEVKRYFNFLKCMYIIEAFIAVILNQTRNSGYSVYYATSFALYSLKLYERLLTLSIIFFSATFKKHQHHLSIAEFFLLPHPLQADFEAKIGFSMARFFIWLIRHIRHIDVFIFIFFHCLDHPELAKKLLILTLVLKISGFSCKMGPLIVDLVQVSGGTTCIPLNQVRCWRLFSSIFVKNSYLTYPCVTQSFSAEVHCGGYLKLWTYLH
ncbi:hypothetical protein T10_5979 [Trichinella papuae]|uniref:Uncharacterized protein n=1 Tax=Trichinella papuae TaxID=268474 RepID=A0A0V1MKL6_9BILA|nr:hypothetical protein T10_5979 [Trichinella papuae]